MIKESNIVWVYLASLLAGFETLSCGQVQIIGVAILGCSLTIKGEMQFSMFGFVAQFSAIIAECFRILMQGVVLSGSGKKLDPMSYCVLVCPPCGVILGMVL